MNPEYAGHVWDGDPNPLKQVVEAVASGVRRIAVMSAVGIGKTKLGAMLVLWWLDCFPSSLVVTTAPKKEQLSLHLWRELDRMFPLFAQGELANLSLRMLPGNDDWRAVGFVAGTKKEEQQSSAARARGFHAEDLLIICEETPGIGMPVLRAFQDTAVSPHNIIVAFGNPDFELDSLSQFARDKDCLTIRVSGYDHPNVVLKNPRFIPGAQTQQGLDGYLERYGETGRMYLSRARGIVTKESSDSVIPYAWLVRASASNTQAPEGLPALGVDAANSLAGDPACIAYGVGPACLSIDEFPCPDSNILGRKVAVRMEELSIPPNRVGVDAVGVGAGTYNELRRLGHQVRKLMSGNQTGFGALRLHGRPLAEKFVNLRAIMWWQLRLDLQFPEESHLTLPKDERLFEELTAPRWKTDTHDRILIESKDEIKARLGRSTNKADALVYWNWVRQVKAAGVVFQT